jgi:hypothetical protein
MMKHDATSCRPFWRRVVHFGVFETGDDRVEKGQTNGIYGTCLWCSGVQANCSCLVPKVGGFGLYKK